MDPLATEHEIGVELATGYGLDAEIADACEFSCRHDVEGDAIFLFGFSRWPAQSVQWRVWFTVIGLPQPHQLNAVPYVESPTNQPSSSTPG
ncbi:phospholipase effector Tle1 domain-containing protein [Mesorhizobium camelthorni]|uniref:DUF2235 domain-containing protein n=1 Tax=Allomesorhizobium camelthorni TaxID=475069 RepID=A0A6G4WE18_9HYPH|nr:DUF2235 domain-containing protein [Mesorhizobium camelthorni]